MVVAAALLASAQLRQHPAQPVPRPVRTGSYLPATAPPAGAKSRLRHTCSLPVPV